MQDHSKELNVYHELCALVDALNKAGIAYAVCGGLAVIIYGYARSTKDIDLLVQEGDVDRIRSVVEELGFRIDSGLLTFRTGTPEEERIYRILKVVGEDILMLDLLLVGKSNREIWHDRTEVELEGRRISVVSPRGLKVMKLKAGRLQDLADIECLGWKDDQTG